ncbi:MAG: MTH938/NDUFAF3 family protein [Thermoguttaceae bacterium]
MRFLLKAEMPVEAGNAAAKKGDLEKTIRSILDDQKPEAVYFLASNGKRTAFLFVEMEDASQIPALAEPWFHAFQASVEIVPVMAAEDLKKAAPTIEEAVRKYGQCAACPIASLQTSCSDTAMHPHIQNTGFGFITVDDEEIDHDILIRLSGKVKKRKKKLSKEKGDSHTISLAEAKHILDDGAERLIIGSGQYGKVKLSEEADHYFKENDCSVELHPTPDAIKVWNEAEGKTIGMFHVTC